MTIERAAREIASAISFWVDSKLVANYLQIGEYNENGKEVKLGFMDVLTAKLVELGAFPEVPESLEAAVEQALDRWHNHCDEGNPFPEDFLRQCIVAAVAPLLAEKDRKEEFS